MDKLTQFNHALSDTTRWRIAQLIVDQALCACELADIFAMPQSTVSSHLQVMKKAGLLESERCEKWIYYKILPEYKKIIEILGNDFEATKKSDPQLKLDAKRAIQRLGESELACCPRPKNLKRK